MLGERIASQSEVIRAIVSGYGPCCGVPHHQIGQLPRRDRRGPVRLGAEEVRLVCQRRLHREGPYLLVPEGRPTLHTMLHDTLRTNGRTSCTNG